MTASCRQREGPSPTTSLYGLALETSSAVGSVALGVGNELLQIRNLSGPRMHSKEFLPAIAAICEAHSVDPTSLKRLYVSSGPGSFTGLRIGITVARMIALATGAKIVSVPTLEVIAQNALEAPERPEHVIVLLDAKRRRVYAALFEHKGERYEAVTDAVEADPGRFLSKQASGHRSCAVLGEGICYHGEAVKRSGLQVLPESLYSPRADTVYHLGTIRASSGRFTDYRKLTPTYIRPPEAEEKWNKQA